VAGADLAYDPRRDVLYAAVLVFRYPEMALVEARLVTRPIVFPYVPGLLSFRELPAILHAWRRLRRRPQLVLCDGQGIAHPRGVGLASHLGLLLGVPAIGCAKSRLVGEHGEVGPRRGDRAPLRFDGRIVGAVLRTRQGAKPVYVSPGHLIGLPASVRFVLGCCRGFRVPEPIRRADRFVAAARRRGSAPAAPSRLC
jgi:deoxyribonuclease V